MHPNDPSYQKPVFSEPKMFYVLYSPSRKMYLDEDGEYCKYEDAEKFDKPIKKWETDNHKWVGPCEEGEEP